MMANPIALLGLLAIAIPIIIHLLGRHQSRVEKFPTLQFIGTSRLNPTSRKRISDLLLLLVRCAIVAVAALALTQPSWLSRTDEASELISRVVIVDTSASMSRLTPTGPVAAVVARQMADRASGNVGASVTASLVARRIETEAPGEAIKGAVAWLDTRPGMREVVIISDFQRSSVDTADFAAIPAEMGLTLSATPTTSTKVPRTQIEESISTFADTSEAAAADASWRAIGRARPTPPGGRITVIYRMFPAALTLGRQALPVDSAWMVRLVTALQRDQTLAEAAIESGRSGGSGPDTIAVNRRGEPVLIAGRNGAQLQFMVLDNAGSLMSAAFNAALTRAVASMTPASEIDTATWTAEEIERWQRPATPSAGPVPDASDGRWLWVACLVLIGLEMAMRSRMRAAVTT